MVVVSKHLLALADVARGKAVPVTDDWWKSKMAGKEGVDWVRTGLISQPVFEPVMSDTDQSGNPRVLVEAGRIAMGRGMFGEVMIVSMGPETVFQMPGWGFKPDTAFVVTADGTVMKAGYDVTEASSGPQGCFPMRKYLNLAPEKRTAANLADTQLMELIVKLEKALA